MKPRLRMLVYLSAVSLVMGFACTYGVAWRCFLDGHADQSLLNWSDAGRLGRATPDDVAWIAAHAPVYIVPPTMARQQTLTGYRLRVLSGGPDINCSMWYRAGWPLLAVAGEEFREFRYTSAGARDQRECRGMIVFRDRLTFMPPSIPYLPLRPLWPGFAIDALFFAAATWLLLAAPFAVRRSLRMKRGLCPKCAYPVGESAVCTECGVAVKGLKA